MIDENGETVNWVTMGITRDSTPDEVRAGVAKHERLTAELQAQIVDGALLRTACRWVDPDRPLTGNNLLLERQKTAGEEDQSVSGWDQGA